MNKKMMFAAGRTNELSVGDVLLFENFFAKDGHQIRFGVIFSEYYGAATVWDGGRYCTFLPKRKLRSGEIRAFHVSPDPSDGNAAFLRELKKMGEERRHDRSAFLDWYSEDDSLASFAENLAYLRDAIERNGYLYIAA